MNIISESVKSNILNILKGDKTTIKKISDDLGMDYGSLRNYFSWDKDLKDALTENKGWEGKTYTFDENPLFYVYYLPEHHYVGMSRMSSGRYDESKEPLRIRNHRNQEGRITEGYEVLYTTKDPTFAALLEAKLHNMGYNGCKHVDPSKKEKLPSKYTQGRNKN